jgi:hypothetical protein
MVTTYSVSKNASSSPSTEAYFIPTALELADTNYSDNLDYSSFPNYELLGEYPFEMYTRIAPGPSVREFKWNTEQ